MTKIATFDGTVAVLVKAYLEGVLAKGTCYACAVGNICAAALGIKVTGEWEWSDGRPAWNDVFATVGITMPQGFWPEKYRGIHKAQIDATGYSVEELMRIEFAFERAMPGQYTEEAEYAGLLAVVDELADIHGVDLATTESAKQLFVRA